MALPTASDNPFPSILITEGTEPTAPAAGKQRLYIDSTSHKLKRTDSSGTDVTIEGASSGAVTSSGLTMATSRLLGRTTASTGAVEEISVGAGLSLASGSLTGGIVLSTRASRTSGGITANSTTWANLDTGMDLTIAASTGHVLLVNINGIWGAEAPLALLQAATIVAAAPVNFLGSGEPTTSTGNGLMGWAKLNASTYTPIGGSVQYVVQAGDISGGNVLLRLRYRVTNATGVTMLADTTSPFRWGVVNLKA